MLGISNMDSGCIPPMFRCGCWVCLSDMYAGCVPRMVSCKYWVSHSSLGLDISGEEDEDLHEG